MNDQRRRLVRISLQWDEALLLRHLARAEGVEPTVLAHRVLMSELWRELERQDPCASPLDWPELYDAG